MSIADKEKWDKKYLEKPKLLEARDASKTLQKYAPQAKNKQALELACGSGRNTLFLAKQGFDVDAMDIAEIALDTLQKQALKQALSSKIQTHKIDLEKFRPKNNYYDLVVMTNYLDRDLIKNISNTLKSQGLCIIETYMQDENNNKEVTNDDYLLKQGELKTFFSEGFEIVFYDEFDNEPHESYRMKKQAIVVKKL